MKIKYLDWLAILIFIVGFILIGYTTVKLVIYGFAIELPHIPSSTPLVFPPFTPRGIAPPVTWQVPTTTPYNPDKITANPSYVPYSLPMPAVPTSPACFYLQQNLVCP